MYFQLKKNHVHRFFLSSSNLQKISIFCQQDKKLSYLSGDRVKKNVWVNHQKNYVFISFTHNVNHKKIRWRILKILKNFHAFLVIWKRDNNAHWDGEEGGSQGSFI